MNKEEIKKQLSIIEKSINNPNLSAGMKAQVKAKQEKLQAELEKLDEEKPKPEPKAAKKPAAKKAAKPKKGGLGKDLTQIKAEQKGQKSDKLMTKEKEFGNEIVKKDEETYLVHFHNSKDVAALNFKDGEWKIDCCNVRKHPTFKKDDIKKALHWIQELNECVSGIEARRESRKATMARRAKRKAAGLPAETTPAETAKKAEKVIEKKVEKAKSEGKPLNKKQVASTVTAEVGTISKVVKESNLSDGVKKRVQKHVDAIRKIFAAKKYAGGGTIEVEKGIETSVIPSNITVNKETGEVKSVKDEGTGKVLKEVQVSGHGLYFLKDGVYVSSEDKSTLKSDLIDRIDMQMSFKSGGKVKSTRKPMSAEARAAFGAKMRALKLAKKK